MDASITSMLGYSMRVHAANGPTWAQLLRAMFAMPAATVIEYHDDWRRTDRVLRYVGRCVVCRRRTWAADDGENDPRGVLGDSAASPLHAGDCDMEGPDVPLCFLCANEYDSYQAAYDQATRTVWRQREGSDS
jgi:hypothetical protein